MAKKKRYPGFSEGGLYVWSHDGGQSFWTLDEDKTGQMPVDLPALTPLLFIRDVLIEHCIHLRRYVFLQEERLLVVILDERVARKYFVDFNVV